MLSQKFLEIERGMVGVIQKFEQVSSWSCVLEQINVSSQGTNLECDHIRTLGSLDEDQILNLLLRLNVQSEVDQLDPEVSVCSDDEDGKKR